MMCYQLIYSNYIVYIGSLNRVNMVGLLVLSRNVVMCYICRRCIGGVGRIAQIALHQQYPALFEEGPAALNTNPPVIYVSPAAPPELELQLSLLLSVGRKSVVRLPAVANGCPVIDVTKFEEIINLHKEEGNLII